MAAGSPLKLALFGSPVDHSLSPRIHRAFGEQQGISLDYRTVDSSPARFHEDLRAFAEAGGVGANLTVPVKTVGAAECAQIDRDASEAGAVNTLVRRNRQWFGSNTDGAGLLADFGRLGIEVRNRRVLVLGAGGAAAGILGPLLRARPVAMSILNRTVGRAEALAKRFPGPAAVETGALAEGPSTGGFELVIQATSLGHHGDSPPVRGEWLDPDAVAYDLNYGPAHEHFRARCRRLSIDCHDGLGMLVEQAAGSFELWTGLRPSTVDVLAGLREGYHSKIFQ